MNKPFEAGDEVVVLGRVDADVAGADLLGKNLYVVEVSGFYCKTSDGSIWYLRQDGGWNSALKGESTAYQSGLRIEHVNYVPAVWT